MSIRVNPFSNYFTDYATFTQGVPESYKDLLIDIVKDVYENHSHLFDDEFFFNEINGEKPIMYIVPAIRKAFASFFIQTPGLFENDLKRLELFQLQFNIEELLKEVSEKLKNNINKFGDFPNLDIPSELLSLIVNDYVASKINMTRVVDPIKEIRNIKIERHLKL